MIEYEYQIYSYQRKTIFVFEYSIFAANYWNIQIIEYICVTLRPLSICTTPTEGT
jgi:hypothetical protein